MASKIHAYEEALAAHDSAVAGRGLALWLGGEPTFTDRASSAGAWNGAALGDDKRSRGERVVAQLARSRPGAALLRPVGKQYPGEDLPRWCYGVYARRDGASVWTGPPDPLLGGGGGTDDDARRFRNRLAELVDGRSVDLGDQGGDDPAMLPYRVVCGAGITRPPPTARVQPLVLPDGIDDLALTRVPLDSASVPDHGRRDELAERGVYLYAVGVTGGCVRIDLPAVTDAATFARWLDVVAEAARDAELDGLVLGGFPPPVDASVWWATVTPDPGVLEINSAPESSVADYYRELRRIYSAAADVGLAPYRLYFNGDVAESGGGSHVTIGGPSPADSPFFRHPHLVPRLVAYANRHPSLSYLFAPDCVGSSSQSPRADEVARESFEELAVALDAFATVAEPTPVDVWSAFAPFLADRFGNTHRAEINVEKLWNPFLPLRGRLGVVELRAVRMAAEAERSAAIAALFRAVVAYLAVTDVDTQVVDWGPELHDRFALPQFLFADLGAVLADLRSADLGLGHVIEDELMRDRELVVARVDVGGVEVVVRAAREFWPIVGDGSRAEQTSRLMDASGARVEVATRGGDDVSLVVAGYRVPWADGGDGVSVRGVRYRRFAPTTGIHPHIEAVDPLVLDFVHRDRAASRRLSLHGWRPDGGAYDGVPADFADAARRRADRAVVTHEVSERFGTAPTAALTPFTVDTRRLR